MGERDEGGRGFGESGELDKKDIGGLRSGVCESVRDRFFFLIKFPTEPDFHLAEKKSFEKMGPKDVVY